MPSPVDEESATLNKTMRKGVETKGQEKTVCKCDNCTPTDLKKTIVDKNGSEEIENIKNSSKAGYEQEGLLQNQHCVQKTFMMEENTESQDFIVTFSCTKCACIVENNYSGDKELRKRKKKTKCCVCMTVSSVVVFCLSVVALLCYLTYSVLGEKRIDNHTPDARNQIITTVPIAEANSQTFIPPRLSLIQYELDIAEYNELSDKILPWSANKGSNSANSYRYQASNRSISVLETGVYFIQATLIADTTSIQQGEHVTILPCITYKSAENCQRLKIPGGISIPIHLQDTVKLDAFDTVMIKVLSRPPNYIYNSAKYNTLTITRLS